MVIHCLHPSSILSRPGQWLLPVNGRIEHCNFNFLLQLPFLSVMTFRVCMIIVLWDNHRRHLIRSALAKGLYSLRFLSLKSDLILPHMKLIICKFDVVNMEHAKL